MRCPNGRFVAARSHDDDVRRTFQFYTPWTTDRLHSSWRDPNFPLPDEEAFEAIKAGVDAMPKGVKMFLNSGMDICSRLENAAHVSAGEFYGPDASIANLELLSRFYAKYPEYAQKTFLSVKVISCGFAPPLKLKFLQGGTKANSLVPDGS